MVDLHTHVLHEIDDGSPSLENSLLMLEEMSKLGVHTVVCTPHFDYRTKSPDEFIALRDERMAQLKAAALDRKIDIKLVVGCELKLNTRMLTLESVREFCIGGTRNILLELAVSKLWDDNYFDMLTNFCDYYNVRPIIAHVERYFSVNKSLKYADRLIELGALLQLDASSINEKLYVRTAKKLLKKGYISVIASDTHNLDKRAPHILADTYNKALKFCKPEEIEKMKHIAQRLCVR